MSWPAPANTAIVRISTASGAVHVMAEADRTECWSNIDALDGSPMTIDGGSSKVEVRVPEGTDLVIGSTSGKVTVEGRVGALSVLTTSGRISIDQAASVDARSTSGRVEVGHADGVCRVVSASGKVEVGRCGSVDAASGSGRIVLERCARPRAGELHERQDHRGDGRRPRRRGRDRVGTHRGLLSRRCRAACRVILSRGRRRNARPRLHGGCSLGQRPSRRLHPMTPDDPRPATDTVLFTDLVGFTEFTDAFGDAAAVAVLDAQLAIAAPCADRRQSAGQGARRRAHVLVPASPACAGDCDAILDGIDSVREHERLSARDPDGHACRRR